MAAASGEQEEVVLETRDLRKHFGGVCAVNGLDLTIPYGDLRAIIGPNGAGKTTLFNLITGDLRHESGRVSFRGEEISRLSPDEVCRRGIGRTFQITSVFRRLTVIENVQTALLSHHRRHYNLFADAARLYRDSALALLDRVGLKEQAGKPGGILAARRSTAARAGDCAGKRAAVAHAGRADGRHGSERASCPDGSRGTHRGRYRAHGSLYGARHGRGLRRRAPDHGHAPGLRARRGHAAGVRRDPEVHRIISDTRKPGDGAA